MRSSDIEDKPERSLAASSLWWTDMPADWRLMVSALSTNYPAKEESKKSWVGKKGKKCSGRRREDGGGWSRERSE
jgi:hypothetical protein